MPNKYITRRVFYFDFLRAISCLAVILLHASSVFVSEDSPIDFSFYIGNLIDSISRFCVPIFVMISGALILDENYQYSHKKLLSHIKRLIIFFVFWSATYCLFFEILKPLLLNEPIDIYHSIYVLFSGYYHLWFIPMIIGIYLLVPLLRLWIKRENERFVRYYLILFIAFSCVPTMINFFCKNVFPEYHTQISSLLDKCKITYVIGYVGYFILGWYLHQFGVKKLKLVIFAGTIGLAMTFGVTWFLSAHAGTVVTFYDNLFLNIVLYAIMIFSVVKEKIANRKIPIVVQKATMFISKYSLGIYAIHVAIINIDIFIFEKLGISNALLGIPFSFASALVGSIIICLILNKIPLLNKLI